MPGLAEDEALLNDVVAAVQAAGNHLKGRFSSGSRLGSPEDIRREIRANDDASQGVLREALRKARPGAGWLEDEHDEGALPPGEWWVTDPVEGNINHIHGMADWCVTAALVRDNLPVLAAVYLPLSGDTYTALRGGGASLNGVRLQASGKTRLDAALVGTGQAKPGEDRDTHRRMGQSVTAMLDGALLLRVSVPSTLQLIQVAAGRMDAFWQYSRVRSGLLAGALLVEEAGGRISDTRGHPWSLTSGDFLAAAPGVHGATVGVLSTIA
jgi:myo-inositol-1(or 4)-monophosphatase